MNKYEERGFIRGLAYAVGWIISSHDQPNIAIELLEHSGYTYADLLKAGCDSHDLQPIEEALKKEQ